MKEGGAFGLFSVYKFLIMCLYEREMINPKYTVNKKNMGNVPTPADLRIIKIKTACGWCKECRSKLASNWLIRMTEEIKSNNNANFVTLSLSPEAITKLEEDIYKSKYRGISEYKGETDVNILASFSVRRFCERWRKANGKSPRHFIVTELGHTGSERIHLHGLIWGDRKDIEKHWQYGNIYIGSYVDERTIKYITKYITKTDTQHSGYKQAIFVSKGLGKEYVETHKDWHKFAGDDTRTKYKLTNGKEIELPRYYKEKLWTEEEREQLYIKTLNDNIITLGGEKIKDNTSLEEFNKKLESVRNNNKRAGYGNNESVVKKYIITEAMKTNYKEIPRDYQGVKYVEKRTIKSKHQEATSRKKSKANNTVSIVYGQYTGTTTEAQRNYNKLIQEADEMKVSVKTLRLIKAGIISK